MILTAALMLPSSIFAEILAAREEAVAGLRDGRGRSACVDKELSVLEPLVVF
jgi:hypothetical protein